MIGGDIEFGRFGPFGIDADGALHTFRTPNRDGPHPGQKSHHRVDGRTHCWEYVGEGEAVIASLAGPVRESNARTPLNKAVCVLPRPEAPQNGSRRSRSVRTWI
jgi:hypothetical protein